MKDITTRKSGGRLDSDLSGFLDNLIETNKLKRNDTAEFLKRSCYVSLKQIAPNPHSGFNHGAIVHPSPATRDDLMTPAWSRYLPDIPKQKSPHGWVSCPPHEEDVELREKSATRNKVWYNLFYKKDYSKTENESSCFNVMKNHRSTKSLHDVLLTRKPSDDVIAPQASRSCSG
ncbi:uncharacterized protein LOC110456769 isoform X2 [Mizuhopecten yessoensis]|uniref:uncharacterized protein LOC110456769 isoform X2 n=1 Tax=Mizuhopecten yessoensis TaxID=6573 RepID=UPI000B45ACA7|nr:uncharacterized protein LOC110456769 isoform X2 [Mizuhopecten yessoensis]